MGRRIYIHEYSLLDYASRNLPQARSLVRGLFQVTAAKTSRRNFVEDGVGTRLLTADDAKAHWKWASAVDYDLLSACFRGIAVIEKGPDRYTALLSHTERLIASCHSDGYFTFATDTDSAAMMFADEIPMKELRASHIAGEEHTHDLTLVRGANLAPLSALEGRDVNIRALIGRQIERSHIGLKEVIDSEAERVDAFIVNNFNVSLEKTIMSDVSRQKMMGILERVRRIVSNSMDFLDKQ